MLFFVQNQLLSWLFGIALSFVMVKIAFPAVSIKALIKLSLTFFLESGTMAALVQMIGSVWTDAPFTISGSVIYVHTSSAVLLFSVSAAYILVCCYDRFIKKHIADIGFLDIDLLIAGKKNVVKCICDTGNFLKDPIHDVPMILINQILLQRKYGFVFEEKEMIFTDGKTKIYGRLLPIRGIESLSVVPVIGECEVGFRINENIFADM